MEVYTTGTVVLLDLTTGTNGQLVAVVGVLDQSTQMPEYFLLWDVQVGQVEPPSLWDSAV
jgi:hypothetical protein